MPSGQCDRHLARGQDASVPGSTIAPFCLGGLEARRDRSECRLAESADACDELGSIERCDLMAQYFFDRN
jgi:hypothetical protein